MQRLRARYVFPVSREPIAGGVVTLDGASIAAIDDRSSGAVDLGNVALLPGLVNAHTHLDLSDIAAPLGQPGTALPQWIVEVIRARSRSALPIAERCALGMAESLRLGTATLGDIVQEGWGVEDGGWREPDVTGFMELIAPTAERVRPALDRARRHLEKCVAFGRRGGISPHAPYSIRPELLEGAVQLSRDRHAPLAMHLAESAEEIEFLATGEGPFRELLERLGAWDATAQPASRRPLDYLRMLVAAHRAMVIHGNYLDGEEIGFIARHADQLAVVYCPRTHAWFGHRPYPLADLLSASVTVAVGTDSRASSPDLSILAELRQVATAHPEIPLATVLRMGTLAGAAALGLSAQCGSLEPGKHADLVAVALPEGEASDPHELLFRSPLEVTGVWRLGNRVGPSLSHS